MKILKKNRGYFKIRDIYFYLDFLDPIDRQIIIYKEYENDQIKFLENYMLKNTCDYFLDIANKIYKKVDYFIVTSSETKKLLSKKFNEINHCFFSRKGGFSKGLYKSLNCGHGSKDNKKNIQKKFQFILQLSLIHI